MIPTHLKASQVPPVPPAPFPLIKSPPPSAAPPPALNEGLFQSPTDRLGNVSTPPPGAAWDEGPKNEGSYDRFETETYKNEEVSSTFSAIREYVTAVWEMGEKRKRVRKRKGVRKTKHIILLRLSSDCLTSLMPSLCILRHRIRSKARA